MLLISFIKDVKELAKVLFWEVIDEHCDGVAMETMRDVGKMMELSMAVYEDVTSEVLGEISQ